MWIFIYEQVFIYVLATCRYLLVLMPKALVFAIYATISGACVVLYTILTTLACSIQAWVGICLYRHLEAL